MKRPRIYSKNFEEIYLRATTLRRFMHKADPAVLNDPDFKRTVKYMTKLYFVQHRSFFTSHGFEFDDLHSIVTLYALAYMGMPRAEMSTKSVYTIMMSFIRQRVNFLMTSIVREFNTDDVMVSTIDDFSEIEDKSVCTIELDGERMWSHGESVTDGEISSSLEDRIFTINEKLTTSKKSDQLWLKLKRSQLEKESVAVEKKISTKRKEFLSTRKSTLKELRALFMADPAKYSNQLSYYATTKHVSKDIRKKARLLCKKYGIDYKTWLKEKLNSVSLDSVEFDT